MNTSCSFKSLGPPVALLAIALTAPLLSGCTAGLYAAQLIPTAIVGYQVLPGDASVELSKPGTGVISPRFKEVRSVVTDNHYSLEYLQAEPGLFSQVKLAKAAPLGVANAASMARQNGYDAFMMVDTGGQSVKSGILGVKMIYGSATVTLVSQDGAVLYKQAATLSGKANSTENLTQRQVAEFLAKAIVDDLKRSKADTQETSESGSKGSGLLNKIKSVFN